jgi:hypothetical protein
VGTIFLMTRTDDPADYARRIGTELVPRLAELG